MKKHGTQNKGRLCMPSIKVQAHWIYCGCRKGGLLVHWSLASSSLWLAYLLVGSPYRKRGGIPTSNLKGTPARWDWSNHQVKHQHLILSRKAYTLQLCLFPMNIIVWNCISKPPPWISYRPFFSDLFWIGVKWNLPCAFLTDFPPSSGC